jgi:hypothetical protein
MTLVNTQPYAFSWAEVGKFDLHSILEPIITRPV